MEVDVVEGDRKADRDLGLIQQKPGNTTELQKRTETLDAGVDAIHDD